MAAPQEPEEEPLGDEHAEDAAQALPEATPDTSAEDALWRAIVDNYGERPQIDEPEIEVPPSPRDLDRSGLPDDEGPDTGPLAADPEDRFVPPEPPPLPTPPPARLLAWIGLFGVPAFVLVALVAKLDLPSWMGLLLMLWFVGGFVFLVASMRPGPGGDHDDGARI
jgi:hypothetical protein